MKTILAAPLAASLLLAPLSAADVPPPSAPSEKPAAEPIAKTSAPAPDIADLRQLLQRGLFEEEAARDYGKAAAAYSSLLAQYDTHRTLAATALFRLAEIRVKQEKSAEAIALFQRFLREFPSHETLAPLARERLAALGKPVAQPKAEAPQTPPETKPPELSVEEFAELRLVENLARTSPDLLQDANEASSPLCRAAGKGWARVASFLLNHGAAVDGVDGKGAPLTIAAAAGHKEIVELLLQGGAKVTQPADAAATRDETALGAACDHSRLEVIKILLARGADPNLADRYGRTALFRACNAAGAKLPMATLLLERGAKPDVAARQPVQDGDSIVIHDSRSPLTLSVQTGEMALLKLLLGKGADPNFNAGLPDQAPLVHALLSRQLEAARLLLDAGAKPEIALRNELGWLPSNDPANASTLLHSAAARDLQIATLLVQKGASPQQLDGLRRTPLHRALLADWQYIYPPGVHREGDPLSNYGEKEPPFPKKATVEKSFIPLREFCAALLAAKDAADLNAPDAHGDTPLHYAMNRPDLPEDLIRWLVAKGADPMRKNASGFTPTDVAAPARMMAVEREFLYPKIQRNDALLLLLRLDPRRSDEPLSFGAEGLPNLASLLWQTIGGRRREPQGKQMVETQFNYPFDVLIFRPDEKGVFAESGKLHVDLGLPPKPDTWPALKLGDIVIFHREGPATSLTTSDSMRRWLEDEPATKKLLPATASPVTKKPGSTAAAGEH